MATFYPHKASRPCKSLLLSVEDQEITDKLVYYGLTFHHRWPWRHSCMAPSPLIPRFALFGLHKRLQTFLLSFFDLYQQLEFKHVKVLICSQGLTTWQHIEAISAHDQFLILFKKLLIFRAIHVHNVTDSVTFCNRTSWVFTGGNKYIWSSRLSSSLAFCGFLCCFFTCTNLHWVMRT